MISLIVAISSNNIIGNNNEIPWKSKKDLKYFKNITEGGIVIMGRKTFESLNNKPLKNRKNIIITSNNEFKDENIEYFSSIERALDSLKNTNKDIFFIGGSRIYEDCIKYCDKLYITEICKFVSGNVTFPQINFNNWDMVSCFEDYENDFRILFKVYNIKK